MKIKSPKKHSIMIVQGVEGLCVYLNNFRICGPKPWGGGTKLAEWVKVESDDIKKALNK